MLASALYCTDLSRRLGRSDEAKLCNQVVATVLAGTWTLHIVHHEVLSNTTRSLAKNLKTLRAKVKEDKFLMDKDGLHVINSWKWTVMLWLWTEKLKLVEIRSLLPAGVGLCAIGFSV